MPEMINDAWFRMFPGDWESGTSRLPNDAIGAYDRLLMNYYTQGPLPNDIELLQGLTRVRTSDWARIWGAISGKFYVAQDGRLHHERCDKEIQWRNERIDKLLRASQMGVDARRKTAGSTDGATNGLTNGATDGRTDGSTIQNQNQNQNVEPESKSDSKRSLREETPFQKRSMKQQETWIELAGLCREVLGEKAYEDEPQWYQRIQTDPNKLRRVLSDLRLTMREQAIDNPPAYAETLWKEFK